MYFFKMIVQNFNRTESVMFTKEARHHCYLSL